MGRTFSFSFSDIHLNRSLGIDWKSLVRIDGNTKETRVGVDEVIFVPDNRVPKYTCIVEIIYNSLEDQLRQQKIYSFTSFDASIVTVVLSPSVDSIKPSR